jgi:hypothetical protein
MKGISGPVAAAAITAALFSFAAPAAEARTVQQGGHGGMSIPYVGRHLGSIPYLGSLRHGSISNLAALRNGSIPHLGSLRRFGSIRDLGSLRSRLGSLGSLGSVGSLGSIGSLGGLGGFGGFGRWFGGGGRDLGAAYD